jgi:hypothetical protein
MKRSRHIGLSFLWTRFKEQRHLEATIVPLRPPDFQTSCDQSPGLWFQTEGWSPLQETNEGEEGMNPKIIYLLGAAYVGMVGAGMYLLFVAPQTINVYFILVATVIIVFLLLAITTLLRERSVVLVGKSTEGVS